MEGSVSSRLHVRNQEHIVADLQASHSINASTSSDWSSARTGQGNSNMYGPENRTTPSHPAVCHTPKSRTLPSARSLPRQERIEESPFSTAAPTVQALSASADGTDPSSLGFSSYEHCDVAMFPVYYRIAATLPLA